MRRSLSELALDIYELDALARIADRPMKESPRCPFCGREANASRTSMYHPTWECPEASHLRLLVSKVNERAMRLEMRQYARRV